MPASGWVGELGDHAGPQLRATAGCHVASRHLPQHAPSRPPVRTVLLSVHKDLKQETGAAPLGLRRGNYSFSRPFATDSVISGHWLGGLSSKVGSPLRCRPRQGHGTAVGGRPVIPPLWAGPRQTMATSRPLHGAHSPPKQRTPRRPLGIEGLGQSQKTCFWFQLCLDLGVCPEPGFSSVFWKGAATHPEA